MKEVIFPGWEAPEDNEVVVGKTTNSSSTQKVIKLPYNPDALEQNHFEIQSVLYSALEYARKNWYIFPMYGAWKNPRTGIVHPCFCGEPECRGKHPWVKFSVESTTDTKIIRDWWKKKPLSAIGVNLWNSFMWVLDIDLHDPKENGFVSLKKLTDKYGDLPETFTVETGKGEHYYWSNFMRDIKGSGPLCPGVDVKGGLNSYVVTAPSLHASGKRYKVKFDARVIDAPQWLLNYIHKNMVEGGSVWDGKIDPARASVDITRLLTPEQKDKIHLEGHLLRGSHPVHGSTSHRNFMIDTRTMLWFCNRCGVKGAGLLALASVLSGEVDCAEYNRSDPNYEWPLVGETFWSAYKFCREHGITREEMRTFVGLGVKKDE